MYAALPLFKGSERGANFAALHTERFDFTSENHTGGKMFLFSEKCRKQC